METKQVIVFRKDILKGEHGIRKGKFAAQCCHASLGSLLKFFVKYQCVYSGDQYTTKYEVEFGPDCILDCWLNGIFTKIVVGVDNEEQLLELNEKCEELNIPHALITDAGLTEFHGVPTNTCLGIGPWESESLNKLTGHLSLL